MKESNLPSEDRFRGQHDLRDDLQAWKVNPTIPPRFQAEVWQKIAARQADQSLWSRVLEWMAQAVVRPQFAAALILIAGITGGGLAQIKVHQANERSFKSLESQYVASIDPYAHLAHQAEMGMQ